MNQCKNILLIEDDDIDAESITRILDKICADCKPADMAHCGDCVLKDGYNLNRQVDLSYGLEQLEEHEFDLILLDLGLPDVVSGHSIKKLRDLYPGIPIVVLTGLNNKKVALKSLRDGAQDFLVKGDFNPQEFQRCITYAIERHRLKRDLENAASELTQKSVILQSVINYMGDGVVVTDPNGQLTLFNPAAAGFLDVSWLEEPPEGWPEAYGAFHPVTKERIPYKELPIPAALRGEIIDDVEILVKTDIFPEGRYVSVTARSILGENEKIDGCVAVLHDITKRRQTDLMKDEFVSTVSHELRTPLTSINGSLGLILGGIAGELPEAIHEMIQVAQRNSNRLVRLINDLLDIQKLEAGKMELAIGVVSVDTLIDRAILDNTGYAQKYNVTFEYVSNNDKEFIIDGDEDRLLQVMANFLSNAAKYSPEFGTVRVSAELTDSNDVCISVSDDGPGIPEEFHSTIFGKFAQADSSTTRQKEGTGLGLSICKAIVDLHGGEIGFESERGKGATFYFSLPVKSVQDREPIPA